jgi:N-acetyltransferase
MNENQLAAYLDRIGAGRPDSALDRIGVGHPDSAGAAALRALHRAHLMAVPFENLGIHLGEPISLAPGDLIGKIVTRRRGGFCYELNGAFALLQRVQRLLASVSAQDAAETDLARIGSAVHVVLDGDRAVAAAGYLTWPGGVAHLSVLTDAAYRGRGLAKLADRRPRRMRWLVACCRSGVPGCQHRSGSRPASASRPAAASSAFARRP